MNKEAKIAMAVGGFLVAFGAWALDPGFGMMLTGLAIIVWAACQDDDSDE